MPPLLPLALVATLAVIPLASPRPAGAQQPSAADALTGAAASADSARREIEAASERADIARLAGAVALLDRALAAAPDDPLLAYYKALALYRQAPLLDGRQKKRKEASAALDAADRLLERVTKRNPDADAIALRSAVVGQKIGLSRNPLAGVRLGPRAIGLMDDAMKRGPQNPRVWLLKGMSSMFAPAMFGGGVDKAERELRRAVVLFEAERVVPPAPSWGRADAHIWLGQAYEKLGRRDDARAQYEAALALQPANDWVRRELLPKVTADAS